MSMRSMKRAVPAACLAIALLASTMAGCGREVKSPSLAGARDAFGKAQDAEHQGRLQDAEKLYLVTFEKAEAALGFLVPGDALLPEAEKLRNDSAARIAAIREELRKQAVSTAGQPEPAGKGTPAQNLPPPVAPFAEVAVKGPEAPPPAPPDGQNPPQLDGTAPAPGAPAAGEAPKPEAPTAEPEQPKAVRITRAVLKDNKAVLINWTVTNIDAGKDLVAGAPAGKVLNERGNILARAFLTFMEQGFQYNAADPGASTGTKYVVDGAVLKPGESRNMVTVVLVGENVVGQVGGAAIELRMSDGNDLTDKLMKVVAE